MKTETRDLLVFLLIMAGLWVLWLFGGGPENPTSKGGFFISPPKEAGGSGETFTPTLRKNKKEISSGDKSTPETNKNLSTKEMEERVARLKRKLEELKTEIESSSFKDKISIENYGNNIDSKKPQKEYLTIQASRGNEQTIPITGWKLKSKVTNKTVTIPKGTKLPNQGEVNTEKPILLKPGEEATVVTGSSPIGVSFKINKCTGYFEQNQDFIPSLRENCPDPEDTLRSYEDRTELDEEDIDYIDSIRRCHMELNYPSYVSNKAREFLSENINYAGCVNNYREDEDFFSDEWRIYLDRSEDLWRENFEKIQLLDSKGKLVDELETE